MLLEITYPSHWNCPKLFIWYFSSYAFIECFLNFSIFIFDVLKFAPTFWNFSIFYMSVVNCNFESRFLVILKLNFQQRTVSTFIKDLHWNLRYCKRTSQILFFLLSLYRNLLQILGTVTCLKFNFKISKNLD